MTGGLGLLGSGQNGHNKLEVLDVERADGVVAGLSVLEHLFGGNKCHERLLLSLARIWTSGVVVHKAFLPCVLLRSLYEIQRLYTREILSPCRSIQSFLKSKRKELEPSGRIRY